MLRLSTSLVDPVLVSGLQVAGFLLLVLTGQAVLAQSPAPTQGVEARIGLGGVVRLGHWAPVTLIVNDANIASRAKSLEITCPDDADIPVTWSSAVGSAFTNGMDPDGTIIQGLFRLGRPSGTLGIRLLDEAGGSVFFHSVSLNDSSMVKVVDGTSRIVLLLGQSEAFQNRIPASSSVEGFVVATIRNPAEIPVMHLGLQSASQMIVGGSTGLVPDELRGAAIGQWVRQGGHLLYISNPDDRDQNSSFATSLVPGTLEGNSTLRASTRLEFLARAREQLPVSQDRPLTVSKLVPADDAEVLVQERELPLVVRRATGFGIVTWTAFALDSSLFTSWQGTSKTIEQLILKPFADERSDVRDAMATATARHGFVDLAGQLRMALENFSSVRLVNFTSVAAIAVFAILLFGIGDWFLLRFFFPARTWTWLTFPLMVLAICLAAWSIRNWARPAECRLNRLEIVDIDQQSGLFRGSAWNCLYVPASTSADLNVRVVADWLNEPDFETTGWQGQPGSGLGGMQTQTGISIGGGSYSITNSGVGEKLRSTTRSIDLAPSSARTFRTQYSGHIQPGTAGQLVMNRRMGRLEGVVVNTLPVRLVRARVYFGEFVYVLQRNLEPGEAVGITEMIERTSRTVLNRRSMVEDLTRRDLSLTTPWQATDTDFSRIADMIMFHSLAGGSAYSGLSNNFYEQLEMSPQVYLNRAILVGEASEVASLLSIATDGDSAGPAELATTSMDNSVTIVRIVLPVAADSTSTNDQ